MIRTRLVTYPLEETKEQKKIRLVLGLPQPMVSYTVEWDDDVAVGVRDTSRMSYNKLKATGKLNRQQAQIMAYIEANPGRNWTRQELAAEIKYGINVLSGRARELLDMKALKELPRRTCKITGEPAHALMELK